MRAWTAVLFLSLALIAPTVSNAGKGGGGGHSRGSKSIGSGGGFGDSSGTSTKSVHVRSYTKKDGTVVQEYDRSPPGLGTGTSRSKKSTHSTSNLTASEASPSLAPSLSQVPRGAIAPSLGRSTPTNTQTSTAANTQSSTQATNGSQTTANNNTIRFVNGYPFWAPWSWGYTDPETLARRQYGPLVTNARNLIGAGIYPQAVSLLQRVITRAPGTRIAAEAQRLLQTVPAF
jgi:hypothetical protein